MSASPRRNSIAATDDLYEKKKTRKRSYSLGGSQALEEFKEQANPGKGILKRYSSFGLDPDTKNERTYNDNFDALNNTVIGIPNSIMFASKQMNISQEKEPPTRSKGRRSRVSFASHARVRWYQNESDRSRISSDSPPSVNRAPGFSTEERGHSVSKESSANEDETNNNEAGNESISSSPRRYSPPPELQENESNSDMDVTNSPPPTNPVSNLPNPSSIVPEYQYASRIVSTEAPESPPANSNKTSRNEDLESEMSMDVTMRFHDDNSYLSGIESLQGSNSTEQTPSRQIQHVDNSSLSYHHLPASNSIASLDRGVDEEQDMMLTRSIDVPRADPEDFSNQMDISMELTSSHISPIRLDRKLSATGTPRKDNGMSIVPPATLEPSDSPSQNPTDMDLTTRIVEKQPSPLPSSEEEAMDITQNVHSVASPVHVLSQSDTQTRLQETGIAEFADGEESEMNVTKAFDLFSPSKRQMNDTEEPMDVTGVINLPYSQTNENNDIQEQQEEAGTGPLSPIQRLPSPNIARTTYEQIPPHKKPKRLSGNLDVISPSRSEIHPPKEKASPSSLSPNTKLDRSTTRSSRRKQRFSTSAVDMDTKRQQRLSTIRNARKSISTLNDLDFVSFPPASEQNSISNASPKKNESPPSQYEDTEPAPISPLRREIQHASVHTSPAPESSSSGYFTNSKIQEMEKDSFISPIAIKLQPLTFEGAHELGTSMDVNVTDEENALHDSHLQNVANEIVPAEEEKQNTETSLENALSSYDPVLPALTIDEFLSMTEIEFLDNITSSKRRETIISGPAESQQLTTAQLLESYYLQFPILELYRFSCQKLEEYIIEGKDFVTKMAEVAHKNNPLLFYEYRKASSEMKALMNSQFRIIKTFSRLQAQGYWYEWREALMQGIKQELDENLMKLKKNLIQISETRSKLLPFFKELRTNFSTVSTKVEALRKRKELFGQYSKELVLQTQSKFEDLQKELNLKRKTLIERQAYKRNLEKEIDDLTKRCKGLEMRCQEEREFYNANQDFEYDEITEYQQELSQLQRKLGWTIVSIRPNEMKLIWNHSLQPFQVSVLLQVRQEELDLNVKAELAKRSWTVSDVFDTLADMFHNSKSKIIKKNVKLLKPVMDEIAAYWNQLQELLLEFERLKLYWPYVSFNWEKQCLVIRVEIYLQSRATKLLIEFNIPESALMKQDGANSVYEATSVKVHSVYDNGLKQEPEILKVLLEKLHSVSINAYSFACFEILSIYS
ncbi:kinetochore protein Spc7 [Schizosaccharomyces octosporus yFS286]|uniref:Kinetochore protein Spc7 n=1 Tax=Schizosaccharomyces octosporus (strain yFS286) TaxID=483514 RepID=S9PS59_SCHOY|nr:kinetochore protein Spc7 [Schizosaccharomyces octosporus yFS286]EPX71996.1 kinetochore protein Spc7 [Schizosaccharomyces octosporus yFS286]